MPIFEAETVVACPTDQAFDFLARPANLPRVSPPDLNLKLIEGPERLTLGARFTVQGSKFGIAQKVTSVVTAFEEGASFTDEQLTGPFRRLVHTHRVEPHAAGTRILDRIEYEAPGGLIGLYLNNDRIRAGLEALATYRAERFREILSEPALGRH